MTESAGILLFRRAAPRLEFLIAHPGGPYWAGKDEGAWSIPKGEIGRGEDAFTAAAREFEEETGQPLPEGAEPIDLGSVRQRSGKVVHAFAVAGDFDPEALRSNVLDMQWPPGTGRRITIPEIDRVLWATRDVAGAKLNPAQVPFLDRLAVALGGAEAVDHAE